MPIYKFSFETIFQNKEPQNSNKRCMTLLPRSCKNKSHGSDLRILFRRWTSEASKGCKGPQRTLQGIYRNQAFTWTVAPALCSCAKLRCLITKRTKQARARSCFLSVCPQMARAVLRITRLHPARGFVNLSHKKSETVRMPSGSVCPSSNVHTSRLRLCRRPWATAAQAASAASCSMLDDGIETLGMRKSGTPAIVVKMASKSWLSMWLRLHVTIKGGGTSRI